jgi:arylsulfatase A-like enzyme
MWLPVSVFGFGLVAAVTLTGCARESAPSPTDQAAAPAASSQWSRVRPGQGTPPSSEQRLNVMLIVIDALRRDGLSLYGNPRRTSPNIDALAQNALVFERAYSQANSTKPSIASMMSGVYPQVTGIINTSGEGRTAVLDESFVTLAESFKAHGYATAAFSSQAWITPQAGFAQGFDEFYIVSSIFDPYETTTLVDGALFWLNARRREPFFVYLHVLNPHSPYEPPAPFDRMWTSEPFPPRLAALLEGDVDEKWRKLTSLKDLAPQPTRDEVDYLVAMYESEVAYVDWTLGNLFRWLKRFKLDERTLVVVTADHGEYFGEHGNFGHGGPLYNPVLSIPLIFASSKLFPAQERIAEAVEAIDIYPTLMDLVGIESPAHLQGESLLREPRRDFAASQSGTPFPIKIQSHGESLILAGSEQTQMFDLEADPAETFDLWQQRRDAGQGIYATLERWVRDNQRHPLRVQQGKSAELSKDATERLRAMGYLE